MTKLNTFWTSNLCRFNTNHKQTYAPSVETHNTVEQSQLQLTLKVIWYWGKTSGCQEQYYCVKIKLLFNDISITK